MVKIDRIDTSRRGEVTRFIKVQTDLYRDSKYYVPPLWSDARAQLDRQRHPYYEHSDAEFFVAVKDGRDVGRIAVLDNRHYNAYRGERTGFFYLFDAIDDLEVTHALFDTADEWARARGMDKMMGPKGFIAMDAFGVLIEGFEHLPAMSVPYNYEYYDRLIKAAGYEKFTDVFSCWVPGDMELDPRVYEMADRVKEKRGITIKRFRNKKELIEIVPAIVDAYNKSFTENWEFYPVTESESKMVVSRLVDIVRPDLIKLAMKGDEIIGFLLGYPNICEAIKKTGGRLWPFGFIRLLWAIRTSRRIDLNGFGVLPQHQGRGAHAVMYAEMAKTVHENGVAYAELVQMEEKNDKMQAELKRLGAIFHKAHRIYTKPLA